MLVTAMGMGQHVDGGRLSGLVVGTWGAVQATSAGAAMAVGGALRDGVSVLAMSGAMGEALVTPITAYSFVYHLEIYLLFVVLVALGPMLRASRLSAPTHHNTPSTPFGLAQLPG
jgi:BCD family chlorophyll transporter-like MFS transporter